MGALARRMRHRLASGAALCILGAALVLTNVHREPLAAGPVSSAFPARIAELSEHGGYFDTDNLISNERSYLQVLPDLRRAALRSGAYIGVGPDTNFSYIAAVRPSVAFIIDIRRDNLLLHLLFKALFELSGSRVEYLANLLGRPVPPAVDGWRGAPIDRLAAYFDRTSSKADLVASLTRQLENSIRRTGVPLSGEDLATMGRFHRRFIEEGLSLRFSSTGRPPQHHYPTYRELLLETDAAGRQGSYLASEESFQFVKSLQQRDLVIPVVGDLAGPSALVAIGRLMTARGERLSAFYTSNVEFYLYGQGSFLRFVTNLRAIPRADTSVIIRSVFGRYAGGGPGGGSASHLEPVEAFLTAARAGRYGSYGALVAGR